MAVRKHDRGVRPISKISAGLFVVGGVVLMVMGVVIGQIATKTPEQITRVEPVVVGEFDTVDVYVPVEPVSKGQRLSQVKFNKIKYPRHQVPVGAITTIDAHLGSFTLTELPAGVPIMEQNLTAVNLGSNPVAERIPAGMRAMTVKVDPASLVNGWAGPGSIVDIALLTPKKSMVIAEKVKVLSTEKFVAPVDGAPAEGLPTTATILVDQEQALSISTAIPHGRLIFMLRNVRDQGNWQRREYEATRLDQPQHNKTSFKGFFSVKDGGGSFALDETGWVPVEAVPIKPLIEDKNG